MKSNIVKCLFLIVLTGCGDSFTTQPDNLFKIDAGIGGEIASAGTNNAGMGSLTSTAGLGGGGATNGGAIGMSMGGATAGNGGMFAAGTGGAQAGANNSAGAGGAPYVAKFCKIGINGNPVNYLCTTVRYTSDTNCMSNSDCYSTAWTCDGADASQNKTGKCTTAAINQADCPESTPTPPDYLTGNPDPNPHPDYSNICTVNINGYGKDGTTNFWCCTRSIRTQ